MKANRKLVIAAAAGLALAAGGALLWLMLVKPPQPVAGPTAPAKPASDRLRFPAGAPQLNYVEAAPVEEVPLPETDALPARIAVDENVTARVSAPVAGRVIEIHAQNGDKVARGAPLVTMDAPDFGAAVADLRKAEADRLRKAEAYERTKSLYEGEAVPRRDLESAQADLRSAEAELQRARLRVENLNRDGARVEGEHLVLRAPIAGVIVERQVNPGMEARPDLANPLFTLSDIAHLWLLIDLPERYLSNVAVNQQVTFTVDAYPSQRFTAKVIRIAQTVDPVTRRVQVRCSVANDDGRLKPEMFASAVLTGAEQQRSLRIPSSAVINEGLYSYVFVQVGPGQFVKRRVSVLRQDASGVYLPAEGGTVSKTDQVVVKGALLLNSELSAGG